MKILKKIWDLIFGVLLIGFAPLIVCFAFSFLMGIVSERLLPSKAIGDLSYISALLLLLVLLMPILTFILAIQFRLRHRLLPKPVIAIEIVLGIAMAFIFFMFFGVVSYSAYGN
jgi:hypothetical protein